MTEQRSRHLRTEPVLLRSHGQHNRVRAPWEGVRGGPSGSPAEQAGWPLTAVSRLALTSLSISALLLRLYAGLHREPHSLEGTTGGDNYQVSSSVVKDSQDYHLAVPWRSRFPNDPVLLVLQEGQNEGCPCLDCWESPQSRKECHQLQETGILPRCPGNSKHCQEPLRWPHSSPFLAIPCSGGWPAVTRDETL